MLGFSLALNQVDPSDLPSGGSIRCLPGSSEPLPLRAEGRLHLLQRRTGWLPETSLTQKTSTISSGNKENICFHGFPDYGARCDSFISGSDHAGRPGSFLSEGGRDGLHLIPGKEGWEQWRPGEPTAGLRNHP